MPLPAIPALLARLGPMVARAGGSAGGLAGAAQTAGGVAEVVQAIGPLVQGLKGVTKFAMHGGLAGMLARGVAGKVSGAASFVSEQTGGQETAVGRTTGAIAGLADAAGEATKGIFGMMRGALKAGRVLNEWSRSSIARQSEIQMYSGQGGMAMMQLNLARMVRDIEQARATSGSFAAATSSRNEFEEAIQPMRQLAQTIENIGIAAMLRTLTMIMNIIQYHPNFIAAKKSADFLEWLLGADKAETTADKFFDATTAAMDKLTERPKPKI